MSDIQLWCRVVVTGPDGAELVGVRLSGTGEPGLGAVDDVARLALMAGRLGGTVVVAQASPVLRALLDLAGLPVEVEGEAELGEEARRVQEGQEE
jgi:hypothetical protein